MAKVRSSNKSLFLNSRLSPSQTRNSTTDSVGTSKEKKESTKQLDSYRSYTSNKKQSTETTNTVTKNQRKKNSSNENTLSLKYESELERTVRLKMGKSKKSHEKLSSMKSKNTFPESSLMSSQNASNATSNTSLSRSKLKVRIPFPINEIKVKKPFVKSPMLPKQKTVNIWKFSDGTTVKKIY